MSKISFVVASLPTGAMILNRNDFTPDGSMGVSYWLMDKGHDETEEIDHAGILMGALCKSRGRGVVVIDGGANVGTHTVAWARGMEGWGEVIAIEAQERVYYALAGNLAINNLFNAKAIYAALSDVVGYALVPDMDYGTPFSSGSVSLLEGKDKPPMATTCEKKIPVQSITIDSLNLERLDYLKLDIEGMEGHAIRGAKETIARCKPVIAAEHFFFKQEQIKASLPGYKLFPDGHNTICIPNGDPILDIVRITPPPG